MPVRNQWTEEENKILIQLVEEGADSSKASEVIGRSMKAVERRCERLGIKLKRREWKVSRRWTPEEEDTLRELVGKGYNYTMIADSGLINRTSTACNTRGRMLGLRVSQSAINGKKNGAQFKREFEKEYPNFEYLGGYVNNNGAIDIRCRNCGDKTERSASCMRSEYELVCKKCLTARNKKKEEEERAERISRRASKNLVRRELVGIRLIAKNHAFYNECTNCGKGYFASHDKKYCSKLCAKRYNHRMKITRRDKRMKLNGRIDRGITIEKIIKRDGESCYLCGEDCNLDDYHIRDDGTHIAGRTYPSIEHVVPISKGGTHTWDNVLLAHRYCNTVKNDRAIISDNGQMNMIL